MQRPDYPADSPRLTENTRQAVASRTSWVSAWVNIVLSAGQILMGVFAHSQGLIADGLHSLSDLIADFVVLLANKHSHKAADEDHQYGHARFENAASLALGVILLIVAAGMLWGAVGKIQNHENIARVHASALWVAVIAIVAKESLFRYMLREAKRVNSSMLIANAWHARSDAASSVVVLLGVGGNLAGFPVLDPLAALIVAFVVGRMGWSFSWDALNDLMDRALPEEDVHKIQEALRSTPGVLDVHDLRTRKMGDMALVDAHLEVAPRISVSEGHNVAVRARSAVLAHFPVLDVQIHIDPREAIASIGPELPSRDQVLDLLTSALPGLDPQQWDITLHYIDGRLNVAMQLEPAAPGVDDFAVRAFLSARLAVPVDLSVWRRELPTATEQ
ncbi:cation diffusion facilitator family transporter [Silvimonas terrae]|uniref:Cation diffusion facilitator family transporter n=1 Tax=Silvimonas terrae TaxID=300266 RepID=A0A840RID8_9NEIS|nr:cation diffusion facilitator family transporter [Silvimonas terrae]MBB5193449.1 cation diffusion facilitator family transporter [Silvimonas terrae]